MKNLHWEIVYPDGGDGATLILRTPHAQIEKLVAAKVSGRDLVVRHRVKNSSEVAAQTQHPSLNH